MRLPRTLGTLMLPLACAQLASPALAAQRTFVASSGADTNPCSITLPCRGFATAVAAVDPNGEVIVLDSAGYGAATIAKAVAIVAPPGIYAGVSVFAGTDGITVSAAAGDKVILRGLTINGQGGNRGVRITSGGHVRIERCAVTNMVQEGIRIEGGNAVYIDDALLHANGAQGLRVAAGAVGTPEVYVAGSRFSFNAGAIRQEAGTLVVTNSRLENNFQATVYVFPTAAGTYTTMVRDTVITGNGGTGVLTDVGTGRTVKLAIERTSITQNGVTGIFADSSSGGTLQAVVSHSHVDQNAAGILASGAGTTLALSASTVSGNGGTGLSQVSPAVFISLGNNAVEGNGAATSGSITKNSLQ